jgi:hypothetical protein
MQLCSLTFEKKKEMTLSTHSATGFNQFESSLNIGVLHQIPCHSCGSPHYELCGSARLSFNGMLRNAAM